MGGIKSQSDKSANKAKSLLITSSSTSHRFDNQVKLYSCFVVFSKYLSLACFSLALISVITLNIITSYSTSQISSRAEPVSNLSGSDQRDIGPTGISISISSSSSTGGNNANLSLLIPQGGGLAVGRHTITVKTGSNVIGYSLTLSSDSAETGLVNDDIADNKTAIPTTAGTLARPSTLADKTYGYTRTDLSSNGAYDNSTAGKTYTDNPLANTAIWSGIRPSSNPDTIATVDEADLAVGQTNSTAHSIYYGVNVQDPATTQAGEYSRRVIYTAAGELAPEPVISSITPEAYEISHIKEIAVDNSGNLYVLISNSTINQSASFSYAREFYRDDRGIDDFALAGSPPVSALVKTIDGEIYSFGDNSYGQLGNGEIGNTIDKTIPANITNRFSSPVSKLFAGEQYSAAITDDNHLYMWGYGRRGNLGTGSSDNQPIPIDITDNFPTAIDGSIVDMVLTNDSRSAITFALTDSGRVYGWGDGSNGALGTGKSQSEYYPVDITDNFSLADGENIVQIAADGGNGNSGHGLALTNLGKVYAWGDNRKGAVGDGSTTNSYLPKDITSYFQLAGYDKIISVGAGINMSFAVSANGVVYAWGSTSSSLSPTIISQEDEFVGINTSRVRITSSLRAYASTILDGNNNVYTLMSNYPTKQGQNITSIFMPDPLLTLTGTNLSGVTNVYIDLSGDGTMQSNEQCTNLTIKSDTELTCDAPTDDSIATGDYTMYIETPYNHTTAIFHYDHY